MLNQVIFEKSYSYQSINRSIDVLISRLNWQACEILMAILLFVSGRLSAPFVSSNEPPSVEILPPTEVPDQVAELSMSPTLCSRIREKCRSVVTPRSGANLDVRLSSRASHRTASDLCLDIPMAHEVIPLNALDLNQEWAFWRECPIGVLYSFFSWLFVFSLFSNSVVDCFAIHDCFVLQRKSAKGNADKFYRKQFA